MSAMANPDPTGQTDDTAAIRTVLEGWARAVREADMDGVLAPHTDDVVMFDVPPGVARGLDEYRATWDLFFAHQGKGAFDLRDLEIAAGKDVAFAHAVVTCGPREGEGQFDVRLTVGLRKVDGAWLITHEHHSVPAE
jgi:uncharacterized protein (TIGR02246 family)